MKKIISLLLILILAFPVTISASEGYISLSPYPFSTHTLGEDLVIYGSTNLSHITIGLYYPDIPGYNGKYNYVMTISAKELREGHIIPTETVSRFWPEGSWKIVAQNGNVRDEMFVPMTSTPLYDRNIRIAEYADNTLTEVKTYTSRGIERKNGILKISLEDGEEIRIFSWNNLSPTESGDTQLFIATFKEGYMTNIKARTGNLTCYGNHTVLNISETERIEVFTWDDNLIPIP